MPSLNVPQAQFLALPHKFKAFVAGFGSGKTWVGCADLCKHHWEWPRVPSGYFAPTYGQIRDIFFPTIDEVAFDWGLTTKIHETNKEVHLYSGRKYRGTVICRSMEKPGDIVGFKIGKALIDELDVMKLKKAETAWRKIIARMRVKQEDLQNGISVTTTPEGFKFVYAQFVKQVRDKPELAALYGLIHASTYENELNLPDDYIPSLVASYPPQLIQAYLRGQFVNLAAGTVYSNFDRRLNHTDEIIAENEILHIGMDFNVLKMSAIINVIRNGQPRALGEITGVRDTPDMCTLLHDRFPTHQIVVYPDASGKSRKTNNASETDHSLLRAAGFTVITDESNPSVRDRINSMQAMFLNGQGERRLLVNTHTCPKLTESLEQQAYDDNGEPDKDGGFDHTNDAQGYFINQCFPIVGRQLIFTRTTGT